MEEYLTDGDGGYSIQINSLIQANTRQAYHIGGGRITPGTSGAGITVVVSDGKVSVDGQTVSFAQDELILEPGGVGPAGADTGHPRVDCISVQKDGTLDVTTGDPEPYAPDTNAAGNRIEPGPFEHWSPSPDSGSRVAGCLLGYVLVEPTDNNADDITTAEIRQWKIPAGVESGAYVLGNGAENGPTHISVTDDVFAVQDDNDSVPEYIKRDTNAAGNPLFLGTADAPATLRSKLDTNGEQVVFDSNAGNVLNIYDEGAGELVASFGPNTLGMSRPIDMLTNEIVDSGPISFQNTSVALDLKRNSDGAMRVWEHTDRPGNIKTAAETVPGGDRYMYAIFEEQNDGTRDFNFSVNADGGIDLWGGPLERVSGILFNQGAAALQIGPSSGDLRYTDPSGNTRSVQLQ